ncbi:MAG: sulfatase [Planctomycetes bacterium]|nr:sulfatase [Planctomycetota bacterium]
MPSFPPRPCDPARRASAAFALLGVCAAFAATGCGPGRDERPSIVLISIDSLRADHLGCYGYPKPTSPTIDAVAAEGLRFETAVSTTSWTLPSHAAMFTGLFDSAHGLVENGLALAPSHVTLAELLADSGYQTAGFFGGPYLHPTYGLHQGFEHYQSCMTQLPDDLTGEAVRESSKQSLAASHRDVTSPRTVAEVRKWIEQADDRPFFAFVHLWDVHYDYLAHPGILELFDPDYQGSLDASAFLLNPAIKPDMDPRDLQHVIALYDNEIRFTDDHVKDLLALFEWKAEKENLIVVITADHGDEFFEHGRKGHQQTLYDEVVKVPLVARWPAKFGNPRVVKEQARLIDLMPTLATAAGAKAPEFVQGRDLFGPLSRGDALAKEPALLELSVLPYDLRVLRTESLKTGEGSVGGGEKKRFGFRLDRDPRETTPLAADDPELARGIEALHGLVQSSRALNDRLGADPERATVDPKLEAWLDQLGYTGGK